MNEIFTNDMPNDQRISYYNNCKLKIKRLSESAMLPTKAHITDLGYDLYSNENVQINVNDTVLVSTDICVKFPDRYGAFIKDRSGVATKKKLHTVAGVIDPDYTGIIKIALINNSDSVAYVNKGDKIAQMVLIPSIEIAIEEVDELPDTQRGSKGFGSSDLQK